MLLEPIFKFIGIYIHLSNYQHMLSVYLFISWVTPPPLNPRSLRCCLSPSLNIYLSIYLFIYLSIYLTIYLFLGLPPSRPLTLGRCGGAGAHLLRDGARPPTRRRSCARARLHEDRRVHRVGRDALRAGPRIWPRTRVCCPVMYICI